jgi:predicted PurR-regulated permease PerM
VEEKALSDQPAATMNAREQPRPAAAEVVIAPRTLAALVMVSLGGVLLLAMAYAAREILIQLSAAIVLAMALEPLVQVFQRRGLARSHAVGLTYGLAAVAVVVFGLIALPPLVDGLKNFIRHVPDLLQRLAHDYRQLGFLERHSGVIDRIRAWMTEPGDPTRIGRPAFDFVRGVIHSQAAAVTIAFLSFFVAMDGRQWFDGLLRLVPEASRERLHRVESGISAAVGGYVSGNVLISIIAGSVTALVLFATGVPYAVPLGLVVAFLDLIPLVGALLGTVIVGAVALTKGVATTAIVVAVMALYQEIENRTLTQLVYHRTVKISALAVAVSVAAGAEIGGIPGALMAIPIAGALKVVGRELLAWRRGESPPEEPPAPRRRAWLQRSWKRT